MREHQITNATPGSAVAKITFSHLELRRDLTMTQRWTEVSTDCSCDSTGRLLH